MGKTMGKTMKQWEKHGKTPDIMILWHFLGIVFPCFPRKYGILLGGILHIFPFIQVLEWKIDQHVTYKLTQVWGNLCH